MQLQHDTVGEEDRYLHVAITIVAFVAMFTKFVVSRATTAIRAECVQWGMGQNTPFSGRGSILLPKMTHDPEGLTANKISVIEQVAYKNNAFIIVLRETHRTTADKLVTPNLSLAGSVLSRKHGLATFVNGRLQWSFVDQSPEQSETECLYVDVAGYKIINVYKPTRSRFTSTATPTFSHPSLYVGDFNCHVSTGVTTKHLLTVRTWTLGQHPTTLDCCMTQRKRPVSLLTDGTSAPIWTWPSRVSARTANCRTHVF